jgi:glycerol-3-phosphate cytidylyltransferase
LIVGVVADDVVERVKGRPPVVPLDERIEIVSELRMVDEVVADIHADKFDTWQRVRYDVIFKGDDWRGTPKGLKLEADLRRVGARIVYFPYTRHTSSTLLRRALDALAEETNWPPEHEAVDLQSEPLQRQSAVPQEAS